MAKKSNEKETLSRDFNYASEAELNAAIAAFRSEHEAKTKQRLAMDSRMSLGAAKARVTFRVVAGKGGR